MRQRSDEPRQVRKEAAVIAIDVCCGVPDLFYFTGFHLKWSLKLKFRLPECLFTSSNNDLNNVSKSISSNCTQMATKAVF